MAQLPHSPGFSSSPRTGKFKPCIARRRSQVVRQRSAKSLFLFLCCPPISGRVHAARTYALPCHELVTGVVASPLATATQFPPLSFSGTSFTPPLPPRSQPIPVPTLPHAPRL